MKYPQKSFTVVTQWADRTDCEHGWVDRKGLCMFCKEPESRAESTPPRLMPDGSGQRDDGTVRPSDSTGSS